MIIGISGKKQHGKDTVAKIIRWLTVDHKGRPDLNTIEAKIDLAIQYCTKEDVIGARETWRVVRFADKLKDIVCILLGCTREQLEDETFKNTPLGKEWSKLITTVPLRDDVEKLIEEREYNIRFTGCYYSKNTRSIDIFYVPTPRLILQLIGTECGRNIIHPDVWVNSTMSGYVATTGTHYNINTGKMGITYPNWIIPDTRFPNEFKAIKDRNGFVVRVDNPNVISEDTHESETALDNCTEFDARFINDGPIENLVIQVKDFLIQKQLLK